MPRKLFSTFSIKRFDFMLVFMILTLNLIGIFAISSAAPSLQMRSVLGTAVGITVMLMICALDYNWVLKFYWILYIVAIVLLLTVILAGSTGGGAQRWIQLGGLTFQPSETVKILLILFYAKFIMKYNNRMKSFTMVAACVILITPPIFLIMQQPDLSTSIMLLIIFSVMMFVGGLSYKVVAAILIVTVPSFIIFINLVIREGSTIVKPYQRDRILAWLHPENYETTSAYQTMYSIMAIGSGQLSGKGYRVSGYSSLLNSGYVSQSQTDFIFTVIGEQFGFIGSCVVVLLCAVIAIRCFLIAREAQDTAGMVIASGMGAWTGFQSFMNIGVATGILPNTGIPLPFVSYGLTSLVSLYMGVGFLLNVRMQARTGSSGPAGAGYGGSNEYSAYRT